MAASSHLRVRGRSMLIIFLVVASIAAGCGFRSSEEPPIPSGSPFDHDPRTSFPVRWLPTPALDLDSSDGTFIRAIAEANTRGIRLGLAGLPPGFERARGGDFRPQTFEGAENSAENRDSFTTYLWTVPFPVDEWNAKLDAGKNIDPLPVIDDMQGAAVVCSYTPLYTQPQYLKAIYITAFTYQRTGTAPPTRQRGALSGPANNVFGDWTAGERLFEINTATFSVCDTPPIPIPDLDTTISTPYPGWPTSGV